MYKSAKIKNIIQDNFNPLEGEFENNTATLRNQKKFK